MPARAPNTPLTDTACVNRLENELADADVLALDTEFNRTNTYRPELCLIQIGDGKQVALIDMLADFERAALVSLISEADNEKLFHAASQDLEALQLNLGVLPNRLFDTQIAAGLLGYQAQIGYGHLVEDLLGITLPKAATRTDWARRPLSTQQLQYAADDVIYLYEIQSLLKERLQELGRMAWAEEDSARLLDSSRYAIDPASAWQRLGAIAYLPAPIGARARALAEWREHRAAHINRPRQWVLADKALLNLAHRNPPGTAELSEIAELPPAVIRRQGTNLLDVINAANESASENPERYRQQTRPEPPDANLLKRLATLVRETAAELSIAPELLATRKELTGLLRGDREQRVTSGWRQQLIGESLLAALPGSP